MTPILELIRLEEHETMGTLGILKVNKHVFSFTLEPPDRLNERSKSSIPAQQYLCRRYSSPKHPDTFEVSGIPGRSKVLFHAGNTARDTLGCILLGQTAGKLRGDLAVLNSGKTFKEFMSLMFPAEVLHLTVREVY